MLNFWKTAFELILENIYVTVKVAREVFSPAVSGVSNLEGAHCAAYS